VLENVPLSRVTEKSNFSTLNVGQAGTGNRTRATCMAGSVSRRSAIHYALVITFLQSECYSFVCGRVRLSHPARIFNLVVGRVELLGRGEGAAHVRRRAEK
jgi:hypothetical protein